jgi:hypothetical protein
MHFKRLQGSWKLKEHKLDHKQVFGETTMSDQNVQNISNDPWDDAENPRQRGSDFWGQVKIDMYYVVLVKGTGKVPFDSKIHKIDQRCTAIDINILPVEPQAEKVNFAVQRSMIAESKEWAGIVLPSIKALGVSPRELNGRFVKAHFVPTGQKYVNTSNESKDRTTFEFETLFVDGDLAVADYLGTYGNAQAAPAAVAAQKSPAANNDRETALKFLKVVVENAARGQSDLAIIKNTVAVNLANMPMVNKYFTAESPETLNLIAEKLSVPAA